MNYLGIRFLVGLLALSGLGPLAVAAQPAAPQRVSVPLSSPTRPASLHVALVSGGVVVEAHDGDDVIVETSAHGKASKEGDAGTASERPSGAEGMQRVTSNGFGLTIEEEDNVVWVKSSGWRGAVDTRILVPAQTTLTIRTVNDGDIRVDGVRGEMELSNTNGGIAVSGAAGPVVANTVNGAVEVSYVRPPDKPIALSTLNGDIDLTVPSELKANAALRTTNGEIYSDFDLVIDPSPASLRPENDGERFRVVVDAEVRGKIGGGGPEIQLKTFNGNIFLRKIKP
jgi:hypothetical protein